MNRDLLKDFLPPILLRQLSGLSYGWRGNYTSWELAKKNCSGYNSFTIIEKVKEAAIKVRNGKALFERDSVIFEKAEYNFQLIATLMWITSRNNGELNVLDFGGSLGSSYFQNRNFLTHLRNFKWNIIEQERFVEAGLKEFSDETLNFHYTIDECLKTNTPDVIILSSVLPYLENPYEILDSIISRKFRFIFFDKMPFVNGPDRITVQKVNPSIYRASYPCWFFNEFKFIAKMERDYTMVFSFNNQDRANIRSVFKGFLFELKPVRK